ncbi:NUDIX hydrolase [Bacillus fonticola]|uniref:NUDIX hydrolase n=1 Tax=Bacillus fonticola TaxID=2728853 RepID=UPI00147562B6|nr:NUDIX hydrolase [Bacillus fonticola]
MKQKNNHHYEEKTLSTEPIFSGRVISLQVDQVQLPNGKTSTRELVKHPGAVSVIAFTKEEKIILVEQYRKPLERALVEIPAGKLEPGEEPLETAKRELEEETGYSASEWESLTSFYTSPGFADELVHVFVAKNLEKLPTELTTDEDEFVDVKEWTLSEAQAAVRDGRIQDAKTAYAVLYWELLQKKG